MILNGLPWKQTDHSVVFEIASKDCISDPFVDCVGCSCGLLHKPEPHHYFPILLDPESEPPGKIAQVHKWLNSWKCAQGAPSTCHLLLRFFLSQAATRLPEELPCDNEFLHPSGADWLRWARWLMKYVSLPWFFVLWPERVEILCFWGSTMRCVSWELPVAMFPITRLEKWRKWTRRERGQHEAETREEEWFKMQRESWGNVSPWLVIPKLQLGFRNLLLGSRRHPNVLTLNPPFCFKQLELIKHLSLLLQSVKLIEAH